MLMLMKAETLVSLQCKLVAAFCDGSCLAGRTGTTGGPPAGLTAHLRENERHLSFVRQADTKTREAFFDVLCEEPLEVLVAVIHKQCAPADFRRLGKLGVYSYALAGLSLRALFEYSKCRVYLDGSGEQKRFLQSLNSNVVGLVGLPVAPNKDLPISVCWTRSLADPVRQHGHGGRGGNCESRRCAMVEFPADAVNSILG